MSHNNCNCERVKALEKRVEKLAAALSHHLRNQPRLLWGWAAIGDYAIKSPRTLQRYARLYSFPVARVGQHVVSSPSLIDAWLVARKQQQRSRKPASNYMKDFWARKSGPAVNPEPSSKAA